MNASSESRGHWMHIRYFHSISCVPTPKNFTGSYLGARKGTGWKWEFLAGGQAFPPPHQAHDDQDGLELSPGGDGFVAGQEDPGLKIGNDFFLAIS